MVEIPEWLPELVLLTDHNGEWNRYLEALYQHFRADFVVSQPVYPGKRWALKRQPLLEGREATFWHLITEGNIESTRLPDLRRCERICWPRPVVECSISTASEGIRVWRTRRRNEERIVIALEDFSYVVVLADRDSYVMLWTAYCVEQGHRRQKLRREYESYRKKS